MHSILAVDDSASMRQMVTFTLKSAGYNVVEAVDGQDALEKSGQQDFDLVLTDQNMPRMDGINLTKKPAQSPEVQGHAHPDPDHGVQRPDEAGRPQRGRDRLDGQALRPGQAARGHQESDSLIRHAAPDKHTHPTTRGGQ
jgi:hypothetical protein